MNFVGLIDLYKSGDKETAYFYLGRIVHLLSDMSVPAHVHNDSHPLYDNFKNYVADHWNEIRQDIDSNGHEGRRSLLNSSRSSCQDLKVSR